MNILIAPDSFKGTLSAEEVCDIIAQAFSDTIEDIKIKKLPAADGGEGLCSCLQKICGGEIKTACVSGVFGEKMQADYLMLSDKTAVIESAVCIGLVLAGEDKNPERATTYGVGELIIHANENGAERILLGLGGSATNDCGFGMAAALGYEFYDKNGKAFVPNGSCLIDVEKINKVRSLPDIPVTVACDVDNPLFGKDGAAYVFAPQKGADEKMVERLDCGLRHASKILKKDLSVDVSAIKGGGAAGGMGAGAVAFLDAELKRGIDILLDTADFEAFASDCDLIITGEGRLDSQSLNGKVISGVSRRSAGLGKKVIAICGSRGNGAEKIKELGVSRIYCSCETQKPFEEIVRTCREDLYNVSLKAAEDIKTY